MQKKEDILQVKLVPFQLCCEVHLDGLQISFSLALDRANLPLNPSLLFPKKHRHIRELLLLFALTDIALALSAEVPWCLISHHAMKLDLTWGDTGVLQHLALASLRPHFSFLFFYPLPFFLLCLPPLILLVLSSGVIHPWLQEDPTPRTPAHHHQASYLCDSPEQHGIHPRCLPGRQASTGRAVDHGQPRPCHLQLHRQLGQH